MTATIDRAHALCPATVVSRRPWLKPRLKGSGSSRTVGRRRGVWHTGGSSSPADASGEEGLMARTVSVQWIKGMKAEATIGPHRVVLDAPAEAGGGDEGPSPAEMLLGAIGA
jgi:hypothetical protein